ncbi:MAG TPA: lipopolysaccharide transport periplasmic protein LptA [Gammaproteobacteria bacterium]
MNNPVNHWLIVLLLSLSCTSLPAYAKSEDSNAPINIEADAVEMREAEGISIYTGNVKISRGSIEFSGDKIIISSEAGRVQQIDIEGQPATFYQLNDQNEDIRAQGLQMRYLAADDTLELHGQALLVKQQSRFSSEHIIYDAGKDVVTAGQLQSEPSADAETGSTEKPRVKITLHPEETTPPEPQPQDSKQP